MLFQSSALKQTIKDIRRLKIQGATAVAREAIQALASHSRDLSSHGHKYITQIEAAADKLSQARPTEPLMHNGLFFVVQQLRRSGAKENKQLIATVEQAAADYLALIDQADEQMVEAAEKLIVKDEKVMTHCHSSVVEKIFSHVWQDRYFEVYNTETRPMYQGRTTAENLLQQGIPVTMVADSAAGFLLSHHSGDDLEMDKFIIGADSISWQGDIYNKIGSYAAALAAWEAKVPVYVAATALKMDADDQINIELREDKEIWPDKPKKLKILNFAFDKIPAKFITGIITEFGIVKPGSLKAKVEKEYPWLIKS